jgi:hypothetical protein
MSELSTQELINLPEGQLLAEPAVIQVLGMIKKTAIARIQELMKPADDSEPLPKRQWPDYVREEAVTAWQLIADHGRHGDVSQFTESMGLKPSDKNNWSNSVKKGGKSLETRIREFLVRRKEMEDRIAEIRGKVPLPQRSDQLVANPQASAPPPTTLANPMNPGSFHLKVDLKLEGHSGNTTINVDTTNPGVLSAIMQIMSTINEKQNGEQ